MADSLGEDEPTAEGITARHVNALGRAARVDGSAVQARDIHGGVHLHHTAAPSLPPPTPRQLAPVPAHFTDRVGDLRVLDALRASQRGSAPRLIVVSGPAGVGKTTLVTRWLSGMPGEFPDGQLYADLQAYAPTGPMRPSEALAAFLRALGVTAIPAALEEQVALWRSLTAELRLAVMLDNALSAAQVRALLPAAPGGLVVVTSRQRLTGLVLEGAAFHQVGMLDPAAALELFRRGVGADRVAQDCGAARQVVSLCACLPLAVCLAAAQLAARPRRPVSALASALERGRGPLDVLSVEGETAVRTALDASYGVLDSGTACVYRCLGLLPLAHYDAHLVAAAGGSVPEEAEHLLGRLVEANLLEDFGTGGYRFHDLVGQHARRCAESEVPEEQRTRIRRRFVDWCLATATSAEELLTPSHRTLVRDYAHPPAGPVPFDAPAGALAWLDEHRTTLMAALRLAVEAGWDGSAWQLADAMWPLFLRLRPYELWTEAHEAGLAAARRAGDRAGEGRMLTSGGNGLCNAGRFDEAAQWFADALALAAADGDVRQQAQALHGLGKAHLGAGRLQEAEEFFSRALALREAIGYRRGAALSRLSLGETALARNGPGAAVVHLSRARAELVAESDPYDAARALAHLGRATARAGDPRTGTRQLLQALADFEAAGSLHWQARTMEMIGLVAGDAADLTEARRWFARSLERYEPISPSDATRLRARLHETGATGPGAPD